MKQRRLGTSGPYVSAIGLGCMAMSGAYGPSDRAESLATIATALERGITLLDTGDFYGMGHNEMLIAEALRGKRREDVILSVKFGAQRGPDGAWLGYDARPQAVKTALAYSLQRLQTDYIDIYRPARLDPNVPIEETIGAIAELVQRGYVRYIGLSEVGAETLRRAQAIHPISDLQIEYAIVTRGIERQILPAARELGIGITAYGVLSRGLIGGHLSRDRAFTPDDFRAHSPRFAGENLDKNLELTQRLAVLADERSATPAQLAIAWVLARGDDIVPLVGARRVERLNESLGALNVTLTDKDLAEMEAAIPPDAIAGTRYAQPQMAMLDSER
ncbi:MAG TPA: aldo/keto reductase [Candidatus Aquilonibacter sp.]